MRRIHTIMLKLWPGFQRLWHEIEQHGGRSVGVVLFSHGDAYVFTSWDCQAPASEDDITDELRRNSVVFLLLDDLIHWISRIKARRQDPRLVRGLELALGKHLGREDFVVLPDFTLVSGMARGKVLLDQNINDLREPLTKANLRVVVPEMEQYARKPDDKLAEDHLANSIFITENYDDFVPLAIKYDFGIIGVPQTAKADGERTAQQISKAIIRHKVWSQTRPFKLLIHRDGRSDFMYLDADPPALPKRKRSR